MAKRKSTKTTKTTTSSRKATTKKAKVVTQAMPEPVNAKIAKVQGTVLFEKFRPKFFIIIAVLVILIAGVFFVFTSNNLGVSNPYLGNSTGQLNQCTANSQCSTGDYCASYGTCVQDFCGDGVCTPQKLQSGSCPIDCGCPSGQVLNKYSETCQAPLNITNAAVSNVVNSYLMQYNITGTITAINNTYYGNQTVKVAYVNCQPSGSKYPCQIVFYVNNKAQIVNTTRTT